jgi:DNA-binding NarL/FixJ family response regulator
VTADQPLRVVIADDQASVREGLVLLLGGLPGIDVVGAAADGEQALELVAEHQPDAILLDLHMPVLDGIGATRRLVAEHPDVAIVVLTTYVDDTSVLEALRAGARSYLTKDADRTDIARALRAAVGGLTVFDPRVHATLLAATSGAAAPPGGTSATPGPAPATRPPDPPDGLTQREVEILSLIAQGLTNGEIAERLFLSNHTIKTHINRIFAKTGSRDARPGSRDRLRPAPQHRLDVNLARSTGPANPVSYLSAPSGAIVSAYLAHGVQGDERRFRGDRDRDDVVGGLRPDLRQRARTSAGFASTACRALSRQVCTAAGALLHRRTGL